jgi:hypothetical protein
VNNWKGIESSGRSQPESLDPCRQHKKKLRPLARAELLEQCNFYIPVLIAFPLPVQKYSTALFDYQLTHVREAVGTGKPLNQSVGRHDRRDMS